MALIHLFATRLSCRDFQYLEYNNIKTYRSFAPDLRRCYGRKAFQNAILQKITEKLTLSRSIDFVLYADGGGCSGVNEGLIYAFPIARTRTGRRGREGHSEIPHSDSENS